MNYESMLNSLVDMASSLKRQGTLDLLTLLIIFWTAFETARTRKANNKSIEIATLPLPLVYFKREQNGKYIPLLKNYKDTPAYDVKVESWEILFKDMQVSWSVEIRDKNINLIGGNTEQELAMITKENGKVIDGSSNDIIMSSFFHRGLPLLIEYKNFVGETYYSVFMVVTDEITGNRVVKMLKHPRRKNLYYYLYRITSLLKKYYTLKYVHFIWKFEKPHWGNDNIKYDVISVLRRWIKARLVIRKTDK